MNLVIVRNDRILLRHEERIRSSLMADGRDGSVSWNQARFIGKVEKPGVNGVNDLLVIAAGQIGTPNAASEECVAGDNHFERRELQADGAQGMARSVEDDGWVRVESNQATVGETFIGRCGFRRGDTKPGCLLIHHGQQGKVILVEVDRRATEAFETECSTDVIDVSVSNENLFQLQAVAQDALVNAINVFAGVDDDGFAGCLVAEKCAVALEGADGKGFEDHRGLRELKKGRPSEVCLERKASDITCRF